MNLISSKPFRYLTFDCAYLFLHLIKFITSPLYRYGTSFKGFFGCLKGHVTIVDPRSVFKTVIKKVFISANETVKPDCL